VLTVIFWIMGRKKVPAFSFAGDDTVISSVYIINIYVVLQIIKGPVKHTVMEALVFAQTDKAKVGPHVSVPSTPAQS
jgi:hypothetical protein